MDVVVLLWSIAETLPKAIGELDDFDEVADAEAEAHLCLRIEWKDSTAIIENKIGFHWKTLDARRGGGGGTAGGRGPGASQPAN